ncbi:MAG: radical SAM protein [Acidobacteria bacterium]|nr:radical SAM protein [Acidobacteriota bacterium]
MHKPTKYLDKGITLAASAAWNVFQAFNQFNPSKAFTPKWADKPMQKSYQKTKPTLGWPRETDSLCPVCVREARQRIIDGEQDVNTLLTEKVGEIKAQIIERDGKILMVKDCPLHGHFEDILSIDPEFLRHIEANFPGRDMPAHNDERLHNHGSSTVKHGRGAILTIDLTNRCNMMCDPCFMDANQVGFVHELSWEDIKTLLDNAVSIKPRRQMSVQFSGGEPTISPYFLDAVAYARKLGFNSVQAATNGIEFAKSLEFSKRAYEAGLRYVYLQFDGIGNANNQHRKVGNLFDVKIKAIENCHAAGIEIILVTTLVNGVNNEQVGPIIEFAINNPGKIAFISFQPVSFTGRDEEVTEERRLRQRYTLSHMAYDVKRQTGMTEPRRDWFPLSLMAAFSDLADLAHGPDAQWGQVTCSCHPSCGVGTAVMVNKATGEFAPVPQFLNVPGLCEDLKKITDSGRGKFLTNVQTALALLRNYDPLKAPKSLTLLDILKKFDKSLGLTGKVYGVGVERRKDPWNFLFIAGMWFQDLWTYDFRRTEMCIIPYATQEGEISFCAYNTGIGWRNIIEKMHMTATLTKWYEEHGRHAIYAGGKSVPLTDNEHSLVLNEEHLNRPAQMESDPTVAHTRTQEKMMANDELRNREMMKLYRQHVLKEQPTELVQIGPAISKKKPAEQVEQEHELVGSGD